MSTKRVLVCLTLLAAPEAARAQTDPGGPAASVPRLRRELRTMEALLDRTVAEVSPPNPGFVLAGAPASRGYLLRGQGVVFVLAPRRLPTPPLVATRMRRRIVIQGSGQASDLRQLEVQVAEFQAQVHQEWQALEQSFDEVQARIWAEAARGGGAEEPWPVGGPAPAPARGAPPSPPAAPAPAAVPLPPIAPEAPGPENPVEAKAPPFPAPPWIQWTQSAENAEPRDPERVVADTKEALLRTLETHGHVLTTLPPDEVISVVVDFVAGTPFIDEQARPARSLSLRVHKRDLDEHRAGRLSADELRGRIEITQY